MEKLIVILVILAVSAISSWLKKRGEAGEENSTDMPRADAPPPRPTQPTSWEEELRRLLEGESPAAPPPRPRPTPPVVAAPPARPVAPPPVRPVVVRAPRPMVPPPTVRPFVVRVPSPSPTPLPVPAVTTLGSRDLAPLKASQQAYSRASQLDNQMAAQIERVPGQHVQPTYVIRSQVSTEVAQVVSMFKNARTARQAVIASIILGSPRALE
jgi:hypothetical protein